MTLVCRRGILRHLKQLGSRMRTMVKVIVASILAIAWFCSPAFASSPFVASPKGISDDLLTVDFKCDMVNGKLVCGDKKGGNNKRDDDDDDDDDDHKSKKKTKGKQEESGLSNCTIQEPGGGGGCKTGFKRVCEKMKSGKKCCGCVPEKNAPAETKTEPPKTEPPKAEQPKLLQFACTSDVKALDGRIIPNRRAGIRAISDAEARMMYINGLPQGVILVGTISCTQTSAP